MQSHLFSGVLKRCVLGDTNYLKVFFDNFSEFILVFRSFSQFFHKMNENCCD